jgi:hypothetical protein
MINDKTAAPPAKVARAKGAKKAGGQNAAPTASGAGLAVIETPVVSDTAGAPALETHAISSVAVKKLKIKKKDKDKKKKDKKKKEAVLIRFDDTQLPLIDVRADTLGLSRAAWVRMVVSQALAKSA